MSRSDKPGMECILKFLDSVDCAVFAVQVAWSGHHGDRIRRLMLVAVICLPAAVILNS